MEHDIFFSISQTPDEDGHIPTEATMLRNYFQQLACADRLGFGVGWIAQAHLSTETQKSNQRPVVPHWKGEVGLCTDFPQLALESFRRTSNIEIGSAVVSILASGGPIAQAERMANVLSLHGLDENEQRCLHVGFSAGRFEFMARPYGVVPRNAIEEAAWPALRGQIFMEAAEIFLRLLRGDVINSTMIRPTVLTRANFRSDEDWEAVQDAAVEFEALDGRPEEIKIPSRYVFEDLKIIPSDFRRSLLKLVAGTHDPRAQTFVNTILPVKVFNLSITSPEVIDATHERMREVYHTDGGAWKRSDMPRTSFVFLNAEDGLSPEEQSAAAHIEADRALSAYWNALEGTIDPDKVSKAANNALIGNVEEVAKQMVGRFHPEDRIMAWFDFFNHDSDRVCRNMTAYMEQVVPRVEAMLREA
ncbi:MAG: luciferase [Euryarchaeota archaeon]|nr:luciferase [Euryarchaeota archaeon]|tara:strand:- start:3105 stop:4355 length:1251 start_codon:yes stop_codon:yes gene_type:complete